MKKYIVINLLGGPGIGKSTLASYLFYILKTKQYKVELITEFAKDVVWEENFNILDNQLYIFANQHHRLWRVLNSYIKNNIDYGIIVTDSPLLLSAVYYKGSNQEFINFIVNFANKIIENKNNNIKIYNLYYLLERKTNFEQIGRKEDLNDSINIDKKIKKLLNDFNINFKKINPINNNDIDIILEDIKKIIN